MGKRPLSTGANGQKEDAACFFCPRSFDRAASTRQSLSAGPEARSNFKLDCEPRACQWTRWGRVTVVVSEGRVTVVVFGRRASISESQGLARTCKKNPVRRTCLEEKGMLNNSKLWRFPRNATQEVRKGSTEFFNVYPFAKIFRNGRRTNRGPTTR